MKLLATIKSVEITRTFQHQDGTYGNVYGVTIESGNNTIIAETFRSAESQKKVGIVPGAIGNATLIFDVNRGTSKAGNPYVIQSIKLDRFDLANQNIRTDAPANAPEPSAEEVAAGFAEAEQKREQEREQAHEATLDPNGVTF